jgi:copper chaperone CopZ
MVHTYQVTGMTCSSCEAKVKSSLLMVENVVKVLKFQKMKIQPQSQWISTFH